MPASRPHAFGAGSPLCIEYHDAARDAVGSRRKYPRNAVVARELAKALAARWAARVWPDLGGRPPRGGSYPIVTSVPKTRGFRQGPTAGAATRLLAQYTALKFETFHYVTAAAHHPTDRQTGTARR